MLHSKHITLPKGKTEATATISRFKFNKGVVSRVWIAFPPGCAGLVKLKCSHEGHPFLPVEEDAYIRGDSYTFDIPLMYEIKDNNEIVTIKAWNEDDVYDHEIDVMFLIVDKMWVQPVGAYEGIVAALASIFRRPPI